MKIVDGILSLRIELEFELEGLRHRTAQGCKGNFDFEIPQHDRIGTLTSSTMMQRAAQRVSCSYWDGVGTKDTDEVPLYPSCSGLG